MTKLSVTESYDVSQIANTNSYQELQTFIDYQLDVSNDVILALLNNLTISDNMVQAQFSLDIQHGTVINIPYNKAFAITSIKSIVPIRSYSLFRSTINTVNLIIYFDQPITLRSDQALWQNGNVTRYRGTNRVLNLKLGDFVTLSGFNTSDNNGTFQVVDLDTTNNYVYVINRKRTSATGDETRVSFTGVDNVKIKVDITFLT